MLKPFTRYCVIFFILLFFYFFASVQATQTYAAADSSFNDSLLKLQNLLRIFTSADPSTFTNSPATPTPSLVDISQTPITGSKTQLVTELVNKIQETCPEGVNYSNANCLNNYPSPLNEAVPALITSASILRNLQCVGFIKGIEQMTNNVTWGIVGNAGGLLAYPPSGGYIPFTNTPDNTTGINALREEDLVIYDYDTYGHVGYVLSRNGDLFTVADANWNQPGVVKIRIDSIKNQHLAGWLRKQ